MNKNTVAIEICGVTKKLGGNSVLLKISERIHYGEVVGVTCKRMDLTDLFMELLVGTQMADQGDILYEEASLNLYGQTPDYVGTYTSKIGFIEEYTGFRNLKYIAGMNGKIGEEEICQAMKEVGISPTNISKLSKYSDRMIQKLGIAQAIMENQRVILLGGILFRTSNKENHLQLRKLLVRLKKRGYTMVIAAEQEEYIEKICTRMIRIPFVRDHEKINECIERL